MQLGLPCSYLLVNLSSLALRNTNCIETRLEMLCKMLMIIIIIINVCIIFIHPAFLNPRLLVISGFYLKILFKMRLTNLFILNFSTMIFYEFSVI